MLPTLVDEPPEGDDWIHELKFDGYRTQIVIAGGRARLFTRNGHDWTLKYLPLAEAAERIQVGSGAVIDGEVIVADAEGKPDSRALKPTIRTAPERLVYIAFDLLHLDGHDFRDLPLQRRRLLLRAMLKPEHEPIRFSQSFEDASTEILDAIEQMGLEGMVSKRLGSRYRSGRMIDWMKTKCFAEAEFGIIGVQREGGEPAMALMADETGNYVGSVFVTLSKGIRERLWQRVQAKAGAKPPKGLDKEKAEWIRPGLIGRVRFLKGEETLRHATLKDVREDQ
jgi:DNA ligase D-like protein (predicted ligase)